jgi:hypothetical protein
VQRLHGSWAGLALLASIASGQTPPSPPPPPSASAADATDLSILYAGAPGGEREKHFVEFLEEWFSEVHTISLEELTSKDAEPFDVVVADWKPRYKDGNSCRASTRRSASMRTTPSRRSASRRSERRSAAESSTGSDSASATRRTGCASTIDLPRAARDEARLERDRDARETTAPGPEDVTCRTE